MPAFINSPFQCPKMLKKGVPGYLFGRYNTLLGNTNLATNTVAIASNVATITATHLSGPALVAGALVSIIINTVIGSGEFNVTRVPITGTPTYNATTNLWTFTFALTGSNVSATADYGSVFVEQAEVGESVVAQASQAFVIAAPEGDSQFTVPFSVTFTTLPTAATITLQKAISAQNSTEWTNTTAAVVIAATAYTAGPVVEATLERGYVYRCILTGLTLGSGAGIVAKIG